jgi:LuxR family maltose regulon positive regulatory protein
MPHANFIIKTKFYLPQPTSDFVERKELDLKFELLENIPVMLVSASTGYGKSTVISTFLRNQKEDHIWLSLSEKENEFQQFFTYFIKAIQGNRHNFGEETLELTFAPEPPSIIELAELLVNNLAELDRPLYMALDDYHLIKNNEIHEFLAKLFEYPQPFFRLIIITRRDPALPLTTWRSKNKLIEIRSLDLKFKRFEIAEFYQHITSTLPNDAVLTKLEEATEGWISALRMLMLSNNHSKEIPQNLLNFNYKKSRVINELVEAVLNNQTSIIKDNLLRISCLLSAYTGVQSI